MKWIWSSNTSSYSVAGAAPRPCRAPYAARACPIWCASHASCSLNGLPSSGAAPVGPPAAPAPPGGGASL